ncbi:hypothetical protein [Stutzerimonas stutzeri]|uniref:hypothetical protein n=1 Tax=Stutzerimonas stutzeri TaxID=316 RepID=UPI00265CEEF5|nr:hypothetical protein [Stutzerimonas stutzeri]MCF6783365.1 hypothetical protein [Stutzerimonas stutzeri]
MYRSRREWAWDDEAELEYKSKREKLAAKGYVTDDDVCRYFAENGVEGVEPEDVRPIMLDAIVESPFAKVMRSLRADV